MNEWQSIETAPKDGTVVDLWVSEDGRYTDCQFDGGLWLHTQDGLTYSLGSDPTHWMPLPPPPSTPKQGEGE